jgi:carboxylesterase type B
MKDHAQDRDKAKSVREDMIDTQIAEFMRILSATELLQAHAGGPGQTNVLLGSVIEDGFIIPGKLLCIVESGDYNKVPLMAGANKSESGSINIILPSLYEGMPNYQALFDVVEGKRTIDEVLPTQNDKELWTKARYYGSQFWRAEMVDELARRAAVHQDDVYVYSFNWGEGNVQPDPFGFIYGAAHFLEIPFFHGNVDTKGTENWLVFRGFSPTNQPGREALSKAMVSYLAQFCRTGDPNKASSGLPEWKPWSNEMDGPKAIILDADLNDAMIRMDNEEVSMMSVRRALDAEDPMVRKHVMTLLMAFQYYAAYEPGQYEYNPCK